MTRAWIDENFVKKGTKKMNVQHTRVLVSSSRLDDSPPPHHKQG
jgi:hypothetical protein